MNYNRTAVFKVHDPSGRKIRRVKKMQRRYSSAYADVLHALSNMPEETLETAASEKKSKLKKRFPESISLSGAMLSGLAQDVQDSVQTYLDTPDANFPAPAGTNAQPIDELVGQLLTATELEEEEKLKAEVKRKGETYMRPIQFVNFRSNPIIRSDDGEKMWVAPHLQKREDGKTGALPPNGGSVRPGNWSYSTSSWHWRKQKNKETLPIELSRWHMHRFFQEGTPTTSKLHVVGNDIYVHYSFRFETERSEKHGGQRPVMGVDRGEAITAAYTVTGPNGSAIEEGSSADENLRSTLKEMDRAISEAQSASNHAKANEIRRERRGVVQNALHRMSNRIVQIAEKYNAAIAFEDLENLSGVHSSRMTRRQFTRLAEYVRYKAEEENLWADVEVPPQGTSTTCPECGHSSSENRGGRDHQSLNRDEFECQRCGYSSHSDLNAGRMIAIRALWQINGGKNKTQCQTLSEYVQKLSRRRKSLEEKTKLSSKALETACAA